jgi:hypothetical protein
LLSTKESPITQCPQPLRAAPRLARRTPATRSVRLTASGPARRLSLLSASSAFNAAPIVSAPAASRASVQMGGDVNNMCAAPPASRHATRLGRRPALRTDRSDRLRPPPRRRIGKYSVKGTIYDPLNLASKYDNNWLREAEIKCARAAHAPLCRACGCRADRCRTVAPIARGRRDHDRKRAGSSGG